MGGKLVTIHLRHIHVTDDERRLDCGGHFQRQNAVVGGTDFVALFLKNMFEDARLNRTVFSDQNVDRHSLLLGGDSALASTPVQTACSMTALLNSLYGIVAQF